MPMIAMEKGEAASPDEDLRGLYLRRPGLFKTSGVLLFPVPCLLSDSRTIWPFVPPNPNPLTAACLISPFPGHVLTTAGIWPADMTLFFELSAFFRLIVGGILFRDMERIVLIIPDIPAAVSRCPRLDLDDPARGEAPYLPKNVSMESSSTLSPRGVPVAWHSTYSVSLGFIPAFLYARS